MRNLPRKVINLPPDLLRRTSLKSVAAWPVVAGRLWWELGLAGSFHLIEGGISPILHFCVDIYNECFKSANASIIRKNTKSFSRHNFFSSIVLVSIKVHILYWCLHPKFWWVFPMLKEFLDVLQLTTYVICIQATVLYK